MDIPHIIVVEELLPEVRRKIARSLHGSGRSQSRIASVLGTSQAMVSRYLKEDGCCPGTLIPMRDLISREILAAVLTEKDHEELTSRFCQLVRSCTSDGLLDERYLERFGRKPPRDCFDPLPERLPRVSVLRDLTDGLSLMTGRDLGILVPAVKVNMAVALPGATDRDDVASFPGRIMDRSGRITGAESPEFGASKHLAGVLVKAIGSSPVIRAAISLAYGPVVAEAIKDRKELMILDRTGGSIEEVLEGNPDQGIIYLVDPGDFGVEPCLYIFGRSANDVVMLTLEILDSIERAKGDG